MTTDRKLLEAAAKAACINVEWRAGVGCLCYPDSPYDVAWNPLTDDGDALRLAVELNLHVWISNPLTYAGLDGDLRIAESHFDSGDRFEATRRAIVRAAAAMAVR